MMMRNAYCLALGLGLLMLTACQSTPTPIGPLTPTAPPGNAATGDAATGDVIGFYQDDPQRSLAIALPQGWVAKLGGEDVRAPIVVTDDWDKYQSNAADAQGIIVTPLTDQGTPEQILGRVASRLGDLLTAPQGALTTSQQGDQTIAWSEYAGKSVDDGTPLIYLLAVVAQDQRSVFVFTSAPPEVVASVRPRFQEIVNGITLR